MNSLQTSEPLRKSTQINDAIAVSVKLSFAVNNWDSDRGALVFGEIQCSSIRKECLLPLTRCVRPNRFVSRKFLAESAFTRCNGSGALFVGLKKNSDHACLPEYT